jgi:hypothetical protein
MALLVVPKQSFKNPNPTLFIASLIFSSNKAISDREIPL